MCFNIEYSCHTITNIKHGWQLSLQLMTNWSLTCNYSNACLYIYISLWQNLYSYLFIQNKIIRIRISAWNGLAKDIAEANTLDIFKSKLQN